MVRNKIIATTRTQISSKLCEEKEYILDREIVWVEKNDIELFRWLVGKSCGSISITYPLSYNFNSELFSLGYTGIQISSKERPPLYQREPYIISGVKGSKVIDLLKVTRSGVEVVEENVENELLSTMLFSSNFLERIIEGLDDNLDIFWVIKVSLTIYNYIPRVIYRDIVTNDTSTLVNPFIQRVLNRLLMELKAPEREGLRIETKSNGEPGFFTNLNKKEVNLIDTSPHIFNSLVALGSIINYLVQGNIVIWEEDNYSRQLFRYIRGNESKEKLIKVLKEEVLTKSYPQLIVYPGNDFALPDFTYPGLKYMKRMIEEI